VIDQFKRAGTNILRDTKLASTNYQVSIDFVKEHRIWEGILKYSWLGKFLLVAGVIGGITFIKFVFSYWSNVEMTSELSLANVGSSLSGFFTEGYSLFVVGGFKYVILIFMEVVIFHFARRTLEIKLGVDMDTSFQAFIKAQTRMIRVVFYSWIMETIITFIIVTIGFSIFGLSAVGSVATFLIQSYFLGFAIIDNYNEMYHMTVKQSQRYSNQYAGVTLVVGIATYILLILPLVGAMLGPLIGAVVAVLTMHELYLKDQNMDWVFVEKEKS